MTDLEFFLDLDETNEIYIFYKILIFVLYIYIFLLNINICIIHISWTLMKQRAGKKKDEIIYGL